MNTPEQIAALGFTETVRANFGASLYRHPVIGVMLTVRLDGRKWTFRFWRPDSTSSYLFTRGKFLKLNYRDLGEMPFDVYTPLQLPFNA